MSFSSEWDEQYRQGQHMSVWPWSDLVSMSLRYTPLAKQKNLNVLEIGCGAGANIPFITTYTPNYFGIDGSESIINNLKNRFPELANQLAVGDFTKSLYFDEQFDLIIDRGASTHNSTDAIKRLLKLGYDALKPGGVWVISTWFSTKHDQYPLGNELDDKYTKSGYTSGAFNGLGVIHFFDQEHIKALTSDYELLHLEHQVCEVYTGTGAYTATWSLILRKPD